MTIIISKDLNKEIKKKIYNTSKQLTFNSNE